jgi:hypothetical protein
MERIVDVATYSAQSNLRQELHAIVGEPVGEDIGRMAVANKRWEWDFVLEVIDSRLWKPQFIVESTR